MSTSSKSIMCPIQARRRQAIVDRIAIHQAHIKRTRLFAMKIQKRKRDVDDDASAIQAPSKRMRGDHAEKENVVPLDHPPHHPQPQDLEEGEISEEHPGHSQASQVLAPRPATTASQRNSPGLTMKDVLAIINPDYVLPRTLPISGVPKDPSEKNLYSKNLDQYCIEIQRTQKFWDEAELGAELRVLRQITRLINTDTIPGLPERISKTLAEVESGMLEEASWPNWRRKMAMLILSIINLNKGRCGDQD